MDMKRSAQDPREKVSKPGGKGALGSEPRPGQANSSLSAALTLGSTLAECTDLTRSASSLLTSECTRVTRVLPRHGTFSSPRKFPQASSGQHPLP